ncbi:MAG: ankyrin repeat domain-containing protein [Blastocatellia bacterium]|nr:ankyrin repeat domain-containing protein [Blastocatellia bacterium]
MSRRLTILDRVSVKSPCQEDWNQMKGNDTVRFCSHCSKSVHNLSEMTRSEAIKLVEQSKGRLCIRYVQTPNKSIITKPDLPRPNIQFGRLGNLATGVFSLAAGMAVLATPISAWGQQSDEVVEVQEVHSSSSLDFKPHSQGQGKTVIGGIIKDQTGAVLPGAAVKITDPATNEVKETQSNANGEYALEVNPGRSYELVISSEGFADWAQTVFAYPDMKMIISTELVVNRHEEQVGGLGITYPSEQAVNHSDERTQESEFPEDLEEFRNALWDSKTGPLKRLLRQKFSVNTKFPYDDTPLMFVYGNPKNLKLLLVNGAKVDQKNAFGVTVLMNAVSGHQPDSVKLLLAAGANVNAQDNQGLSPLMFAAMDNNQEMVSLLLSHGAKINLRDRDGKTALGHAIEQKAEETIEVLKKAGAVE